MVILLPLVKKFLSIAIFCFFAIGAQAAPYVVYSGQATGTVFGASGSSNTSTTLYLVTDLADTSSFAILQLNPASKIYTVVSRPSASPTTEEANHNFFGGLAATTGKTGVGVLSYSDESTDSLGNTFVAHGYATGALTLKSTVLVPARSSLLVDLKTKGVVTGTYLFNQHTPVISSGSATFPMSLTGVFSNHVISSGGALTTASQQGTFTLAENPTLTALANIGGAYNVVNNSYAILPLTIPSGTSAADAYTAWLSAFATASGYGLVMNPEITPALGHASGNQGQISTGSLAGIPAITLSDGTLNLKTGYNAGVFLPINPGTGFSGVLSVSGGSKIVVPSGGLVTGTQVTDPNNPGATLTIYPPVELVIEPPVTLSPPPNLLAGGATVTFPASTITITAVNNGLINATLTSAGSGPVYIKNATLITDNNATLNVGDIINGDAAFSAGTLQEFSNSPFLGTTNEDAGSTITVTNP